MRYLTGTLISLLSLASLRAATNATLEGSVDAYVAPFVQLNTFSGAVMIAKGDEVLVKKAYGLANQELRVPNTTAMRFHLASVSKTFTSAAVMLLQERGRLAVSDPVSKYVSDFPNGDRITIHHLLTDTSGIPNINSMPEYEREVMLPHTLNDVIGLFRNKPLDFQPGTREWTESSSNWVLLAFIIERVSGQKFGEFLRENIFEPLGMAETGHDGDPAALIPNRAYGYAPAGRLEVVNANRIDWSFKTGNGSIYSTVGDLFKWSHALAGTKLLKAESIATMFREHYGWFTGERAGHKVVRYSGRAPGYQCEIQMFPAEGVFVAVLSNNYATTASLIANELASIAFGQPSEPWRVQTNVRVSPAVLAKYTGHYVFGSDFFVPGAVKDIVLRDDTLYAKSGGVETALIAQNDRDFVDRGFSAWVTFEPSGDAFVWRYGKDFYRATRQSSTTPP